MCLVVGSDVLKEPAKILGSGSALVENPRKFWAPGPRWWARRTPPGIATRCVYAATAAVDDAPLGVQSRAYGASGAGDACAAAVHAQVTQTCPSDQDAGISSCSSWDSCSATASRDNADRTAQPKMRRLNAITTSRSIHSGSRFSCESP